jgi:hypothetical protein
VTERDFRLLVDAEDLGRIEVDALASARERVVAVSVLARTSVAGDATPPTKSATRMAAAAAMWVSLPVNSVLLFAFAPGRRRTE